MQVASDVPRRLVVGVVIAIAVLSGALAWYQYSKPSPAKDPVEYYRDQAEPVFRRAGPALAFRGLSLEALVAAMPAAEVIVTPEAATALTDDRIGELSDLLVSTILEFVHARYGTEQIDAYIAWRRDHGASFFDSEQFADANFTTIDDYCRDSGVESSHGLDAAAIESAFKRCVAGEFGNPYTPVAIVTGPGWLVVSIHVAKDPALAFSDDVHTSTASFEVWAGGVNATLMRWFTYSRSLKRMIVEKGSALTARIGLLIEDRAGGRRPVIIQCFYDAVDQAWRIDSLSIQNERLEVLEQIRMNL